MKTFAVAVFLLGTSVAGSSAQAPPPAAERVYEAALTRARAEGKMVFVEFGASWCGPCRRLETFLTSPAIAAILERHLVIVRLTVWENGPKTTLNNPGASELMYRLGAGAGIPFFAIVNGSGKILESSTKAGVSYPARPGDIDQFLGLFDRTTKLAPADRQTLSTFLRERADSNGSIAGRVVDMAGQPIADATVSLAQRVYGNGRWQFMVASRIQSDAGGRFLVRNVTPGAHALRAQHAGGSSVPSMLSVGPGEDAVVDVVVDPRRRAHLAGRVLRPNKGPATTGTVTLTHVTWPETRFVARIDANGAFEVPVMPPGRYRLWVDVPITGGQREGLLRELDVESGTPKPIVLTTHGGAALSGRVVLPANVPASAAAGITVIAVGVHPPGGAATQIVSSPISPSGTFEARNVFGDRYIRVRGLPDGWYLKVVRRGGVDVTDAPLNLQAGQSLEAIEVVLSNQGATLSGTVTDASGSPIGDGTVVVFPESTARAAWPSLYVRRAAVDDAGGFVVAGLPPGAYRVAAVKSLSAAWDAPEPLAALRAASTKVTLTEGMRARVTPIRER